MNVSHTKHDDLAHDVEAALDRLRTLRDRIRVQIHLAGMDAKDEWSKLEQELFDIEHAAASKTEPSREAVKRAVDRLERFLSMIAKGVPGGL